MNYRVGKHPDGSRTLDIEGAVAGQKQVVAHQYCANVDELKVAVERLANEIGEARLEAKARRQTLRKGTKVPLQTEEGG